MSRYRVGKFWSIIAGNYAIQEKKWWGWRTIETFYFKDSAIERAKELEDEGHIVEYHI